MEESLPEALRAYIFKQIRALRQWLKPNPADTLGMKIIKTMGKSLVVLVLTAFSPIILLILFISFIGAF